MDSVSLQLSQQRLEILSIRAVAGNTEIFFESGSRITAASGVNQKLYGGKASARIRRRRSIQMLERFVQVTSPDAEAHAEGKIHFGQGTRAFQCLPGGFLRSIVTLQMQHRESKITVGRHIVGVQFHSFFKVPGRLFILLHASVNRPQFEPCLRIRGISCKGFARMFDGFIKASTLSRRMRLLKFALCLPVCLSL